MQATTRSALSPARIRLIKCMQELNFGRIESLVVRNGEPVSEPPPRVVRDVKFGGENVPRPESDLDDFALKGQVCDLLSHFDSLGNGTIRCLEVKHGLPFRMQMEDVTA